MIFLGQMSELLTDVVHLYCIKFFLVILYNIYLKKYSLLHTYTKPIFYVPRFRCCKILIVNWIIYFIFDLVRNKIVNVLTVGYNKSSKLKKQIWTRSYALKLRDDIVVYYILS